jgi:hypothetical protein
MMQPWLRESSLAAGSRPRRLLELLPYLPECRSELAAVANLRHRNFFLAGKLIFSVSGW